MNFGLIADGNRRWAQKHDLEINEGHREGARVIKEEIIPVLKAYPDVHVFTVYAFSTENWKRSPLAVKNLMGLYVQYLEAWLPDFIKGNIKVVHAGRKDRLPNSLSKVLIKVEETTKTFTGFTIYLCIDYGGRDEIIRAANKGDISKHLDIPDLDIILRTGGEQRLSNFCLWQAAYAELFFIDKYLPEIRKTDIEGLLAKFAERDRRKGR